MIASTLDPTTALQPKCRPDRLILVYDSENGIGALLLDGLKKTIGREDCPLCEITHGPLGKRSTWSACEARLGLIVDALHRNQLPPEWGIGAAALPCILARVQDERPYVLVSRSELEACCGQPDALERQLLNLFAAGGDR